MGTTGHTTNTRCGAAGDARRAKLRLFIAGARPIAREVIAAAKHFVHVREHITNPHGLSGHFRVLDVGYSWESEKGARGI